MVLSGTPSRYRLVASPRRKAYQPRLGNGLCWIGSLVVQVIIGDDQGGEKPERCIRCRPESADSSAKVHFGSESCLSGRPTGSRSSNRSLEYRPPSCLIRQLRSWSFFNSKSLRQTKSSALSAATRLGVMLGKIQHYY